MAQSMVSKEIKTDLGSNSCEEATELQVHFRGINVRSWLFDELGQMLSKSHKFISVYQMIYSQRCPSSLPLICFCYGCRWKPRKKKKKTKRSTSCHNLYWAFFIQWSKYGFSSSTGHSIQNIDSFTQLLFFCLFILFWISKESSLCTMSTVQLFFR